MRALFRFAPILLRAAAALLRSRKDQAITELALRQQLSTYTTRKTKPTITPDPHEIYLVIRETGERIKWGEYKPLDKARVAELQGRLGNLLHPKRGLSRGISNDPWYTNTHAFLRESAEYLAERYEGNTPFFTLSGIDHIELVRADCE